MYHGTYPTLPWGWNTHTHKHIANIWYIFKDLCWLLYLLIRHAHDMKDINNRRVWHFGFKTFANFLRVAVSEKFGLAKKARGILILNTNGTPKDFCFFPYCLLFFIVVNVSSISLQLLGELFSVHPIPTHFAVHTWELPITEIFISLISQKNHFCYSRINFTDFHGFTDIFPYDYTRVLNYLFWALSILWFGVRRLCSMRK